MAVFRTAIIDTPSETKRRLGDFGLIPEQVLAIRDAARAASDDASPLMPLNAPGTLAYIYGVAALREKLLDGEWQVDRMLGIEAVINHRLGIRIGYQNVDQACDPIFKPMPRSAKGPGAEQMCSLPLFDHYGITLGSERDRLPRNESRTVPHDFATTYFVMVGEDGSVELSSPIIDNQRYAEFRERIFVDRPGDDWDTQIDSATDPIDDFDVNVTLKDGA